MPLDYALVDIGSPMQGNMPPAPILPAISPGQVKLAEATNSADIVVGDGSAVLMCCANVDIRMDLRLKADAASLNPATSGVLIGAGVPRFFTLRRGTYVLKTAVY